MNELYELIDDCLFPDEIDALLDEAMILCPAMKRDNSRLYAVNVCNIFPGCTDEFAVLGAMLLNDIAFNW